MPPDDGEERTKIGPPEEAETRVPALGTKDISVCGAIGPGEPAESEKSASARISQETTRYQGLGLPRSGSSGLPRLRWLVVSYVASSPFPVSIRRKAQPYESCSKHPGGRSIVRHPGNPDRTAGGRVCPDHHHRRERPGEPQCDPARRPRELQWPGPGSEGPQEVVCQ